MPEEEGLWPKVFNAEPFFPNTVRPNDPKNKLMFKREKKN
jgi:hypothetical protein